MRPSGAFLVAAAFAVLCGCARYEILLQRKGSVRAPLPKDAPFRISLKAPPLGSVYLGTMTMTLQAYDVEDAFNALRNRVRRIGGNLVARFRCSGVTTYMVRADLAGTSGNIRLVGTNAYCKGDLYYVH